MVDGVTVQGDKWRVEGPVGGGLVEVMFEDHVTAFNAYFGESDLDKFIAALCAAQAEVTRERMKSKL